MGGFGAIPTGLWQTPRNARQGVAEKAISRTQGRDQLGFMDVHCTRKLHSL